MKEVQYVLRQSGVGWDDERQMIDGTDDWWDQFIAVCVYLIFV